MKDLIDRQAALDAIDAWRREYPLSMQEPIDDCWNAVKELPTVQPEVIRCKDCKWKQGAECVRFADVRPFPSDFCSRAERREE